MAEDKLTPEQKKAKSAIDKFQDVNKKGASLIEAYKLQHNSIYNKVMSKHLSKDPTNPEAYDISKMKDSKTRDKVIKEFIKEYDTMTNNYLKSSLNLKEPINSVKGWWASRQIKKALTGINDANITEYIHRMKDAFTGEQFMEYINNKHIRDVAQGVFTGSTEHINETQIPDILKFIGADEHMLEGTVENMGQEHYKSMLPFLLQGVKKEDGAYTISKDALLQAHSTMYKGSNGALSFEQYLTKDEN